MKKILVATALLASMTAANAYQYEVNAGYERTDVKDLSSDIDTYNIGGKFYLSPVNNTAAPLAEAAFLSKASNVGLAYTRAETDITLDLSNYLPLPPFTMGTADIKADVIGLSGEYYVPNSNLYFSASVYDTDIDVKASALGFSATENLGRTGYAVEAGYLPTTGLLLAVGVANMDESVDPNLVAAAGTVTAAGFAASVDDDTAMTFRTKYVTRVMNNDVNFESKIVVGDEAAYRVAADVYLDPTLSVGASFAKSTMDDTHSVYGLRAQKFLTPIAAVGLGFTKTDGIKAYGLNGTFRF